MKLTTKPPINSLSPKSYLQNRLGRFATEIMFNAFALLQASMAIEKDEKEIYWDYRDELGQERLQKILNQGYEGWNEIECEIYDHNYDHIEDLRDELYKEHFLSMGRAMFTSSFIIELGESDIEDLDNIDEIEDYGYEIKSEAREWLMDYTTVNLNLEELAGRESIRLEIDFDPSDYFDPHFLFEEVFYNTAPCTGVMDANELCMFAQAMEEDKNRLVHISLAELESYSGNIWHVDAHVMLPASCLSYTIVGEHYEGENSFELLEGNQEAWVNEDADYVSADRDAWMDVRDRNIVTLLHELHDDIKLPLPSEYDMDEIEAQLHFQGFSKSLSILAYSHIDQEIIYIIDGEYIEEELDTGTLSDLLQEIGPDIAILKHHIPPYQLVNPLAA